MMSRLAMAACGLSRMRELARSVPAAVRPSLPSAASPSMMKTAFVVAVVIRVRVHCRQFHWRQVTPASSRQITSPGRGCSVAGSPCAVVPNSSSPAARTSRAGPWYRSRSSPPTGTRFAIETAL